MIYQTDPAMPKSGQKYGCTFTALASTRDDLQGDPWTGKALGIAWASAMKLGVVSGDLNGDGDVDDAGEAEIQSYPRLIAHLGLWLEFVGKKDIDYKLAPNEVSLQAWYNPKTKFRHWVRGWNRFVLLDPIGGGSITVRDGAPEPLGDGRGGLRVFRKL